MGLYLDGRGSVDFVLGILTGAGQVVKWKLAGKLPSELAQRVGTHYLRTESIDDQHVPQKLSERQPPGKRIINFSKAERVVSFCSENKQKSPRT